ncbi:Signal transduction histidine kinase CheA [hydrothermal vent metagenome]|uniref:histidine kinase n=1 Tax=hydrothermal vent metagenome TaxID=652676 RepID=A0A3B1CRA5_9ZZZZ
MAKRKKAKKAEAKTPAGAKEKRPVKSTRKKRIAKGGKTSEAAKEALALSKEKTFKQARVKPEQQNAPSPPPAHKSTRAERQAPLCQEKPVEASSGAGSSSPPVEPQEMTDEMAEYLDDFLLEFGEGIETLDASLMNLEEDPENQEEIRTSFRQIHNIKGISNALGFMKLGELCHTVETALTPFRENQEPVPEELNNAFLEFVDLLRVFKSQIEKTSLEGGVDAEAMIERIKGFKPSAPAHALRADKSAINLYLTDFISELGENIETIDASLLDMEKEPSGAGQVNAILRMVHNLKGLSNSLGMNNLQDICHAVETRLSVFRESGEPVPPGLVNTLFEFNDYLKDIKNGLQKNSGEYDPDMANLLEKLAVPEEKQESKPDEIDEEKRKMLEGYMPDFLLEYDEQIETLDASLLKLENNPGDIDEVNNCFRQLHTLKGSANALGFMKLGGFCHTTESAMTIFRESKKPLSSVFIDTLFKVTDLLREFKKNLDSRWTEGDVKVGPVEKTLDAIKAGEPEDEIIAAGSSKPETKEQKTKPAPLSAGARPVAEKISTIRVNVARLDNLMNSVGELVLLRNRYNQLNFELTHGNYTEELGEAFSNLANSLDMVTGNLQGAVMRTRMLPVGNIFSKFKRVVRDLGKTLHKEVDLFISGSETELDKNLIEAISDPMMHLIRNCVDHGIEPPDVRADAGKPRRGVIKLNAFQEGNSIVIEVIDDGKGIDYDIVAQKAVEKGLLSQEAVDALSRAERTMLIFMPGFSTAEEVSSVSGRGVGMDVVRTNIEKLKGQIEIDSEKGKGTRLKIRIPLTLAIMPTLLCRIEDEKFALPLFSVMEVIRIAPEGIEYISGAPVIRLRDKILPVIFLGKLLNFTGGSGAGQGGGPVDIVVVKVGIKQTGLVIDKALGQEEVLIKPLDLVLQGIYEPQYISGATILGDGVIALIVDVAEIIQRVKLIDIDVAEEVGKTDLMEEEDMVLLLSDGQQEQYGIDLKGISNIDIVESKDIEYISGQEMIKYGDEIMPVTRITCITNIDAPKYYSSLYCVVIAKNGRKAGLLVNELSGMRKLLRRKLRESEGKIDLDNALIVDGQVTFIIAAGQVLAAAGQKRRNIRYETESRDQTKKRSIKNIMVVDDSVTQREIIKDILTAANYNVILAEDGQQAAEKLTEADLVITDLQMPNMDGYELTRIVKKRYPKMPVIMLTTFSEEDNLVKAMETGVDQFLEKGAPKRLLEAIMKASWE